MVWAYRTNQERILLAIINSGGIKASFNKGNITMEDLLMSFPFRNTYDVVMMKGEHLRQALEHSVANMQPDGTNDAGRFLQVWQKQTTMLEEQNSRAESRKSRREKVGNFQEIFSKLFA